MEQFKGQQVCVDFIEEKQRVIVNSVNLSNCFVNSVKFALTLFAVGPISGPVMFSLSGVFLSSFGASRSLIWVAGFRFLIICNHE